MLRQIPQFKNATERLLNRLLSFTEAKVVRRNQYLFQEGELATHVYICTQGSFLMKKSVLEKRLQNVEHDLLLKDTS